MKKLKIDRVLAAKLLTGAACVGVAFTTYLAVKERVQSDGQDR